MFTTPNAFSLITTVEGNNRFLLDPTSLNNIVVTDCLTPHS